MAIKLDGSIVAEEIKYKLKEEINKLCSKPILALLLAGNNEASKIYVKKKQQACKDVGIISEVYLFSEKEEEKFIITIKELNNNVDINGILMQLPLPKSWDENFLFNIIDPMKDVDCFHPINIGLLVQNKPRFVPPTPYGIQILLERNKIKIAGSHIAILNRSGVVGKPLSSMLIQNNNEFANATVTICHDKTPPEKLKNITKMADIIVVAVGIPYFLTKDMVSPGQVIIDVGVNRLENNKIVGDVNPEIHEIVGWVSKSPGGCGPLTVCMLLRNTIIAYCLQHDILIGPTI